MVGRREGKKKGNIHFSVLAGELSLIGDLEALRP